MVSTLEFDVITLKSYAIGQSAQPNAAEKVPNFKLSTPEGKNIRFSQNTSKGLVYWFSFADAPVIIALAATVKFRIVSKDRKDFAAVVLVYPGPPQDLSAETNELCSTRRFRRASI